MPDYWHTRRLHRINDVMHVVNTVISNVIATRVTIGVRLRNAHVFLSRQTRIRCFQFSESPAHNDYGLCATFKPFIVFFLCDVVIDLIPSISPILLSPIGVWIAMKLFFYSINAMLVIEPLCSVFFFSICRNIFTYLSHYLSREISYFFSQWLPFCSSLVNHRIKGSTVLLQHTEQDT